LAAEMDEMWSFYQDKSHQDWLWWAVDHATNTPIAYTFGTREHKYLDELLALLEPFNIGTVYVDDNYAYRDRIAAENLITGKRNTQQIERDHLTLRTRIKRLCRKTICFSKSKRIHETVIGTFINTFFFGRNLRLSTIL
jgi:insertion element IS1 protein InsB